MDPVCSASLGSVHLPIRDREHSLKRCNSVGIETLKTKRVCGSIESPPNRLPVPLLLLPLEVLVIVLQYIVEPIGPLKALQKYGLVSKEWREILLVNKLWYRVIVDNEINISKALKWLCDHKFTVVKEVDFDCWTSEHYQVHATTRVKLMFARLQRVQFHYCDLKSVEFFKCFTKLQKLHISSCDSYIASSSQLFKNSRNSLTEILFSYAGSSFCQNIIKHNVILTQLNTLDVDKFYYYKKDSISCLQKRCPNLTTLKLSCCIDKDNSVSRRNLVGFPHLQHLEVYFQTFNYRGDDSWKNDVMCSLLHSSPQLWSLRIMWYSSSHYEFIPLVSPNLTKLIIQSCGCYCVNYLTKFLSQCTTLKDLHIIRSHYINDQAIDAIISSPAFASISCLNVHSTNVTVEGIKTLLNADHKLCYLNLLRCQYIPMPARYVYTKNIIQEFYCDIVTSESDSDDTDW
ncbi:uncharacterized protein [Dysidea avara]|uniref:uncharacterized protein n=1 Tax=Dysidea avara TaxID=196820 RepID=UPI003325EBC4